MKKLLFVASVVGVMAITGCETINTFKALGSDPSAEEAVSSLTDEENLYRVVVEGKNEKARIAAMKKSANVQLFRDLVCSGGEAQSIRKTAFHRLVELGAVDGLISGDTAFADVVITGRAGGNVRHRDISSASRRGVGLSDEGSSGGASCEFPIEYRLKAITGAKDGFSRPSLKVVAMDDSAPIEVRIAAIQKRDVINAEKFVKILKLAGDKNNPAQSDYVKLLKASIDAGDLLNKRVIDVICGIRGWESMPLASRKLAFSCLKDEESITWVLDYVMQTVPEDAMTEKPDANVVLFAKYVIAHVKQDVLAKFILKGYHWRYPSFLVEAVNHITDDDLLVAISERDTGGYGSLAMVALTAAKKIKDPTKRIVLEKTVAKYDPDLQTRANAIARVYAVNQSDAYSIVRFHGTKDDDKTVGLIANKDVLVGLLKMNKNDKEYSSGKVAQHLKNGIYRVIRKQMDELPKEDLDKLVAVTQNRAKSLDKDGRTCVIGNYYVGMTLDSFVALTKIQDAKAAPLNWEFDADGKDFIVSEIAFDSKNLYKAVGLEKSQLRFGLPRKIGIASFEVQMTDVKYNRNYFAEALGSYDFNTVSGGDIYYQSENQAKGVVITIWEKSGRLIMSSITND